VTIVKFLLFTFTWTAFRTIPEAAVSPKEEGMPSLPGWNFASALSVFAPLLRDLTCFFFCQCFESFGSFAQIFIKLIVEPCAKYKLIQSSVDSERFHKKKKKGKSSNVRIDVIWVDQIFTDFIVDSTATPTTI
jgi:hypothetical protein